MGFEYDHEKSEANKAKHGIDFEEAQALWGDPDLLEIPAKVTGEPRCGYRDDWRQTLVGGHHLSKR